MTSTVLAEDVVPRRPLASTMWFGSGRSRGRTVAKLPGGGWRRAEQGPAGPLVLEVRPANDRIVLQVWGSTATPPGAVERALEDARAWAGFRDDLTGFAELVAPHPLLRHALKVVGPPILGALPRASESFGRAVLGQLVQGLEAARSAHQLVAMLGSSTPQQVSAWPTRESLGAAPAHQLRRCGIALRSATALHAFAVHEATFERQAAARAWHEMDASLTSIRGVGGWTSAETRLWLGDADAVSVGDYHIPATIGWALGDRSEDDATMLELLAPYAGHRGRVIRLVERAAGRGLVETKPRRGPRQALSAHRYW